MVQTASSAGELLRDWRRRRRLSQLGLAMQAEISQRHLSFVESGRARPSREMVLRLADQLEIPLRERNAVLVAAGYAPLYRERVADDPSLQPARKAVELILKGHEPHPALAVNRHWLLVSANGPAAGLMSGVDEALLTPPVNVLRLSLHPQGLGPRIENFREWRAHIVGRLEREFQNSADPVLKALMDELKSYPVPAGAKPYSPSRQGALAGIAVPLALTTEMGTLRLLSTTTVFGTALDITLSELAIEAFFPADEETAVMIRRMQTAGPGSLPGRGNGGRS